MRVDQISPDQTDWWTTKKNALCLSVYVFSTKALFGDTFFLRLQLETGPPFYVVIWATRKSSRLQYKGGTFISWLF